MDLHDYSKMYNQIQMGIREEFVMSRMTAPTMEVVRFKENDIIATSGIGGGISGIRLSSFNNGTENDAMVNEYHVTDYVGILQLIRLISGHTDIYFRYDGKEAVNAEELLIHEEDGRLRDGIYTPSEEDGMAMWTWQYQ